MKSQCTRMPFIRTWPVQGASGTVEGLSEPTHFSA
jgi:hypothetical protein